MNAAGLAASAAFKDSFIYLTNQYLSGGRMLQSGYMLGGFPHIFVVPSRLARLLHCVGDSVACQISTSAVGDSRSNTLDVAGARNSAKTSYVIAEP